MIHRETPWRDGDEDDFAAVFERHSRAVYNHAFRLTGSWSVAEDVTSATFLTAWRRRADVRLVDGSPLPWLLVTAGHHARTEQRTLTRWRHRLFRAPTDDTIADPADDVAGRLDDETRMREVLTAVRRLPRAEREAVALCLWSGLPYPEAAAILGVTESSVRSRVSRARARLSRQLDDPGPPAAPGPDGCPAAAGPGGAPAASTSAPGGAATGRLRSPAAAAGAPARTSAVAAGVSGRTSTTAGSAPVRNSVAAARTSTTAGGAPAHSSATAAGVSGRTSEEKK
ncbi:RNA polymerase sigma factor [Actinoplanes xinjiangensis]|uniref:RNA polymerase sigma factor n=1 Tax=Actinoplanes xinjiangensis TaxID=512350 RepID=UPI003448A15A